jgi:hypothetical protein
MACGCVIILFSFRELLKFLNRSARLQKDPARRNDEAPGLL